MVKEETVKKKVPAKKKTAPVKRKPKEEIPKKTSGEYLQGTGRRKTSVARVRLYEKRMEE